MKSSKENTKGIFLTTILKEEYVRKILEKKSLKVIREKSPYGKTVRTHM